ncbi:MAG: DUF3253 domain-containing protein [Comamonadaceae bacterium]|nr:MAG: DUF3253 domain-containing protein [Comamonadaceae bacterium]
MSKASDAAPDVNIQEREIETRMLELLGQRSPGSSICPSDVARSLASEERAWRALMEPVRSTAESLARRGVVRVTQGTSDVDLSQPVKGPVRIRRGADWPE